MTISSAPLRLRLGSLRDELRARREARARYRALQAELASYRTAYEVDDLLSLIADEPGPEAEQIREILLDNLRPAVTLRAA